MIEADKRMRILLITWVVQPQAAALVVESHYYSHVSALFKLNFCVCYCELILSIFEIYQVPCQVLLIHMIHCLGASLLAYYHLLTHKATSSKSSL